MVINILRIIVAIATILTGVLALIKPTAIYSFTGLIAQGARGITEIRSIFGGLFIALGAAPFLFGPSGYQVLGFAYAAIAITRIISMIIDKSTDPSNGISLVIEVIFGILLLVRF